MDRLAALGTGLGVPLLGLAGWIFVRYGASTIDTTVIVGSLAVVLIVAAPAATRVRFVIGRHLDDASAMDGRWFMSVESVDSRRQALDAVRTALAEHAVDVEETTFADGDGLTLRDGLQVGFVRVTGSGRLVLGGSRALIPRARDLLAGHPAPNVRFEAIDRNPFGRPAPIRGAPRVAFAVLLVVGAVAGVLVAADGAYEADAYNPLEKTVLLGIDARTAVDPSHSTVDASLDRAAFMTDILGEEATEIRWANDTSPAVHAEQAVVVDRDVRSNLARADTHDLTPTQRDRVARIRARATRARAAVVRAIDGLDTPRAGSRLQASRTALQTAT